MTVTLAGKPATLVFGLDRKITYANMLVHKETTTAANTAR